MTTNLELAKCSAACPRPGPLLGPRWPPEPSVVLKLLFIRTKPYIGKMPRNQAWYSTSILEKTHNFPVMVCVHNSRLAPSHLPRCPFKDGKRCPPALRTAAAAATYSRMCVRLPLSCLSLFSPLSKPAVTRRGKTGRRLPLPLGYSTSPPIWMGGGEKDAMDSDPITVCPRG